MHTRSTLSEYQREQLVEFFEQGFTSPSAASIVKVDPKAAERFYDRWRLHGSLCLREKRTKTQYSFETKKEIVDRHRAGETAMKLASEFHLTSKFLVES